MKILCLNQEEYYQDEKKAYIDYPKLQQMA